MWQDEQNALSTVVAATVEVMIAEVSFHPWIEGWSYAKIHG
jgi:hypothetical protein